VVSNRLDQVFNIVNILSTEFKTHFIVANLSDLSILISKPATSAFSNDN